jgi:hypothetical protein
MQLYGLVQGFGYVIGLNDFKDHATFASTACWGSETPHNLPKPLDDDLEDLFEISGPSRVGSRLEAEINTCQRFVRRDHPLYLCLSARAAIRSATRIRFEIAAQSPLASLGATPIPIRGDVGC